MKGLLYSILGYAALFAGVWLHEIGHSFWNFKFGCKEHWSQVQVKPYIFFSTPGPVNLEQYQALAPWKRILSAYGGILANLFWSLASGGLIAAMKPGNGYLSFFLWMFLTLNLCEIVSYLLIGSLYLVSDMAIVAQEYPRLRIPNLMAGFLLAAVYIWVLIQIPAAFQGFALVWNLVTLLSMCGGRIVFSLLHRQAKN